MKHFINSCIVAVIILFGFGQTKGQDLPIYSQKLTNTFIYNPSLAGLGYGSLSYSYRKSYNAVADSKTSNLIGFHTPFAFDKFGVGGNLFQEKVGIYDRLHGSAAFAYHLAFTDNTALSIGLSGEYNNLSISSTRLDVSDETDELLFGEQTSTNNVDFGVGFNFKTKFFEIGAAANRLSSALGILPVTNQLHSYYTGYARFPIPIEGIKSDIEPIFNFRMLSSGVIQYDAGLYYTFNKMFIVGGSFRNNLQYTASAAFQIKNILVGYSYESFGSALSTDIGSSTQITLRYNFRDQEYHKQTRSNKNISTSSMSYRRKTQTRSFSKAKSMANSSSNRLKKYKKKNYMKSPSYRMNSSKKLNTQKSKKKSFSGKQKKRKKSNHNRYKKKRKRFK